MNALESSGKARNGVPIRSGRNGFSMSIATIRSIDESCMKKELHKRKTEPNGPGLSRLSIPHGTKGHNLQSKLPSVQSNPISVQLLAAIEYGNRSQVKNRLGVRK